MQNKSLIREIAAALVRLEQTEPVENAFLRGFRSGAESAYRDVLAMLERNVTLCKGEQDEGR